MPLDGGPGNIWTPNADTPYGASGEPYSHQLRTIQTPPAAINTVAAMANVDEPESSDGLPLPIQDGERERRAQRHEASETRPVDLLPVIQPAHSASAMTCLASSLRDEPINISCAVAATKPAAYGRSADISMLTRASGGPERDEQQPRRPRQARPAGQQPKHEAGRCEQQEKRRRDCEIQQERIAKRLEEPAAQTLVPMG